MTDRPRRPEPSDSWMRYDDESSTGIPRWVKVIGIILAVVALLAVIMLLVGGGHSPRRHGSSGPGGQAPPAAVTDVHQPPESGNR